MTMPMAKENLVLRSACNACAEFLFAVANDPAVREVSFSREAIAWEEHRAWLERVLASPETKLLIAECDSQPIGTARLARQPSGEWLVSIALAKQYRGRGLGSVLLAAVVDWASREQLQPLTAEVFTTNPSSLRIFERCGFQRQGTREHNGEEVVTYKYQTADNAQEWGKSQ